MRTYVRARLVVLTLRAATPDEQVPLPGDLRPQTFVGMGVRRVAEVLVGLRAVGQRMALISASGTGLSSTSMTRPRMACPRLTFQTRPLTFSLAIVTLG